MYFYINILGSILNGIRVTITYQLSICTAISYSDTIERKNVTVLNNGPEAHRPPISPAFELEFEQTAPAHLYIYYTAASVNIPLRQHVLFIKMCSRDEMSCTADPKNMRVNINASNIDSIFHLDLMTGKQRSKAPFRNSQTPLRAIISVAPNTYKYVATRNDTPRPMRFRCQHFL